ncbi:MAG: hypothetical protein FWG45_02490 [Oscillospiraceae bacterium]|nr:hypothetical protein [Oscillospiraceae bacterium]
MMRKVRALVGGVLVLALTVDSVWEFTKYIAQTEQILNQQFYGHTDGTYGNITNYALYDWTPSGYVQSVRIDRESGVYYSEDNYEYGKAYINGEEVNNEEFELKKAELDKLAERAEDFPLTFLQDIDSDAIIYIKNAYQ